MIQTRKVSQNDPARAYLEEILNRRYCGININTSTFKKTTVPNSITDLRK